VELTLQDVASGVEKTIEFERQVHCETCKGSGAKSGSSPVVCPQCNGQGRVAQQGFGGMFRMVVACPNCHGKGKVIRDFCPSCAGSGRQPGKRTVVIKIPPGVHEGQAVRVAGEGEPGDEGAPNGDLHCYIAIKPHPIFSRHHNDLICQVPISFTQAALGGSIEVPTLRGSEQLQLSAGVQHGEILKLKGKGLPDIRSGKPGDEVVQLLIEIPRKLTEKQKALLQEFAGTEQMDHLPQKKGFLEKLKEALTGSA
jgi:molecular chaperone DnaJ